jgi:flagellar biosynthesis component FlhA
VYKDSSSLPEQQYAGDGWRVVPLWMMPLWKAAKHPASHQENVLTEIIADEFFKKPELILNRDCVKYLLARERIYFPTTVDEALTACHGVTGIRNVLIDLCRARISLRSLENVLDFLAKYARSLGADELARGLKEDLPGNSDASLPLQGRQDYKTRRASIPSNESVLEFPPKDKAIKAIYERAAAFLPEAQQKVVVIFGRSLSSSLLDADQLKAQVQIDFDHLSGELYKDFGLSPPGVLFRYSGDLQPTQFRIETMGKTQGVKGINGVPEQAWMGPMRFCA